MDIGEQIRAYVVREFGTFADLVALQARARPDQAAVVCDERQISYAQLDRLADRIAAALQRDGVGKRGVVGVCASSCIEYAAVFIGTLRAGAAVAPLSPSSTPDQLETMLADCGASHLFLDAGVSAHLAPVRDRLACAFVALDENAHGAPPREWLAADSARPDPVEIEPDQPFNIIYSSGTTGTPKGIVQSHRMRWPHHNLADPPGYGPGSVTIVSTGLYSNTTLVSFIPALAGGGTVVLMRKFDARRFLELCESYRVNFAMLVPVQYRRILDVDDFDRFDLSSFRMKFVTSAPFGADIKAETLRRWPGGLIEYYGMTEGGGSCMLAAHEHPDKLHTVGQPIPRHDIRIIDGASNELPHGQVGEIVGTSPSIMNGYHNAPGKTADAEWFNAEGKRYIRTGDLGRFDEAGFLTLMGRKKDMIISGGINIYPSDLEAALASHPAVEEVAVMGVPSDRWGETPVAYAVLLPGSSATPDELRDRANQHLGKMQRISEVRLTEALPRSAIGKLLKRELQAWYAAGEG